MVPGDSSAAYHVGTLFFPVPSVATARLDDSFNAPRGGGRKHHAIDIIAPKGSPVLAVEDGRILRLTRTASGGISVYATNLDEQFVYYYAHLDGYHPSVYAGRPLMRGDTVGYVGTTGNAPKDTPHLHFQVMRMPADRKFWNGEPINPYPLLRPPATSSTSR
jgi:murein DD-endopeptidase MepM/ murein hydrolase activator NlpD